MKSHQRQTGSAHLVIIIILVLAVIGLLGFVFWQNFVNKKTDSPKQTASTTKTTVPDDQYAGWQTYTNDDLGFTLRYPSDWKLTNTQASSTVAQLTSPDTAAQNTAQANPDSSVSPYDIAVVSEPKSGSTTGSSSAAITALQQSQSGGDTSQYFTKKYITTINALPVTEFDMVAQSPYFAAVFSVGGNYVELDFATTSTKADLSTAATKVLESFKAL